MLTATLEIQHFAFLEKVLGVEQEISKGPERWVI
jgi:hypothetical protein